MVSDVVTCPRICVLSCGARQVSALESVRGQSCARTCVSMRHDVCSEMMRPTYNVT